MSRTYRKNKSSGRDHQGRRREHAPPGIKRLGEQDLEDKRHEVINWLRDHSDQVMTVGKVQGYGYSFRFAEIWAWMFPKQACPARK